MGAEGDFQSDFGGLGELPKLAPSRVLAVVGTELICTLQDAAEETLEFRSAAIEDFEAGVISMQPELVLLDWTAGGRDVVALGRELKMSFQYSQIPVVLFDPGAVCETSDIEGAVDVVIDRDLEPASLVRRLETLLKLTSSLRHSSRQSGQFGEFVKRQEELLETIHRQSHELERANDQLRAAMGIKDRVLSMASHDLRSPLTLMQGFVELFPTLLEKGRMEMIDSLLRDMDTASRHMLALVNDLVDLSAAEQGRLAVNIADCDPVDILDRCMQMFSDGAQKKAIDLVWERPEDLIRIQADGQRLIQVFSNLISNAIKFTLRKGCVTVMAEATSDGGLIVRVADNGIGIPAEEHSKVFGAFETTSARPTEGEKSSGLGMNITQQLVDLHGGDIALESEVGVGTTFTITLPAINV